jgi:Caspase domain
MAAYPRCFCAFVLAMLFMASPTLAQDKRIALVIGNSAYKYTPRLQNPKNDASDVAAKLKALGFVVVEGQDLDKAAADRTLRDFAEKLAGADVGLFFYAGHGLQVGGQNYIVPVDAKLTSASAIDFEMVRLDLVLRTMERETSTNIIIVDACRDNPLARNLARALGTRSTHIGRGLASVESGEGSLISFSTQPGNVALDGEGRNSPFASALLKHMAIAGDDLSTILINVRNDVMRETARRQVPWEHSAMTAKFYFKPPAPPKPSGDPLELTFWMSVKDSSNPAVLGTYLERFPDGEFAPIARALIEHYRRQAQLAQAAREQELKRQEEVDRAARAKRLDDEQRVREAEMVEGRKRAEAEKESAEAKRAEEKRRAEDLARVAEMRKALDELRVAREAAAAAETQRLAAVKAAEQATRAAEKAIATKRDAEGTAAPEKLAALPKIEPKLEPKTGVRQFNGSWSVQWTATSGCRIKSGGYGLRAVDGELTGQSRAGSMSGKVSDKGTARWTLPAISDGAPIKCSGTIRSEAGSGTCARDDGRCHMSFTMRRH